VAARLAQAFSFTQKLTPELKEKASSQVSRILQSHDLSKNARELLEKCI
jgi:Domain of unknown function (DUF3458_C) ARM repeats